MAQNGDYPFKVTIMNKFGEGVLIQVDNYYVPLGKRCDEMDEDDLPSNTIKIKPGERITLPLYCGVAYLKLSISSESSIDWSSLHNKCYYIWAGVKAKIYPSELEDVQYTPSPAGQFTDEDGRTYYCGGTWKLEQEKEQKSWSLEIRKYSPDPEEDDVVVGPDIPG